MLELKQGDRSAFEALMRKYYPRILNFIYRFISNRQIAEDLSQDVFFKVYKSAWRYRQLDDRQRQAIRERYKRWKNLSEEQKQRIREHRRRYQNMTPEQRERLKQKRKKWQNLSPEKKQQLREKYRKQRLRNSDSSRRSEPNQRGRK